MRSRSARRTKRNCSVTRLCSFALSPAAPPHADEAQADQGRDAGSGTGASETTPFTVAVPPAAVVPTAVLPVVSMVGGERVTSPSSL